MRRITLSFVLLIALALVAAACDGEGTPTGTPTIPIGGETPRPPVGVPTLTPSPGVPTITPSPGTPTPTAEPSTPTPPGGSDGGGAAQGEAIFTGQAGLQVQACSSCHTIGQGDVIGPDLQGIATRAATRVAGTSAEDYIRESIVEPNAFVVQGFPMGVMPQTYGQQLSEEQIQALVDYLMTLQ